MVKTGILGGTFNPIHKGHIQIARQVHEMLKLNRVIFIPTGISYKKLELKVLPKEIRAELTKISVSDYSYFECSDIELKKDGYSYTCDTLLELHEMHPDNDFYYIIGTDNLFQIETWNEPEVIFKNCKLAVVSRDDYDTKLIDDKIKSLENKFDAQIFILQTDKIDISSTHIRESMLNSDFEAAKQMLDEKAYNYIMDNELYKYWEDKA